MLESKSFSHDVSNFPEMTAPEPGTVAGYGAIIKAYSLRIPLPDRLAMISKKRRQYETVNWIVLTPRHKPEETLLDHLTFALKYEGIDLGILKKLFSHLSGEDIMQMLYESAVGIYSRKIWFLYEYLLQTKIELPDMKTGNYIDLVDDSLQFASTPEVSKRHRVRNNLPGVRNFCPMIRKTPEIKKFLDANLSGQIQQIIGKIHPVVMARTAAFLLLKDSKASYAIEGERPAHNRAQRWGRAIGQAGEKQISEDEILRLQQIVIESARFTKMGWRNQEGFIGEHDRRTGTPIPDHISARWEDVPSLLEGLISTDKKLEKDKSFDAVVAAALIGFGFVFVHPLVDGNGRLHRYLIHHVLLRKEYVSKGIIFPVSAIILERLKEYRQVLEHFSKSRLDFIEWKPSLNNSVDILNDTIDLYRYFDATRQAAFLYKCVQQTIEKTIPEEVDYLEKYDRLKNYLDDHFEMPDKTVDLLVRFLEQGKGKLSQRAKEDEFQVLSPEEITVIEKKYSEVFLN